MQVPTPAPDVVDALGRLEAGAIGEKPLDDLASLLASVPSDCHPVLVTLHDDGTVVLLFDDADDVPAAPDPWQLADDGGDGPVGWSARLGDRGVERSIGLPLLVSLGRMDDRNVLANFGAMRRLTIAGDPSVVTNRLRAMAMEVATSPVAGPVQVSVAGDDRLASLPQVQQADQLQPEVVAASKEKDAGVIVEDRAARLLIAHHPDTAVDVPDSLDAMVGLITAGDQAAGWTLELGDENEATLRLPDGAVVELVLPEIDADLIDDELDRQEDRLAEPVDRTTNGHRAGALMGTRVREFIEPDFDIPYCEVQLLGPVRVLRGGEPVDGLTRQMREVLAYLATHPRGVTGERLEDAVWAGTARLGSQRVRSVLTKLRSVLGDGPDGTPLLPRRETAEDPIRLVHAGTDIDRALALIEGAAVLDETARVEQLHQAVALVRGEPLEDLPTSWSTEVSAQAVVALQSAAQAVAENYRAAGKFDFAEGAVRQGLALCDPYEPLYVEWAEIEIARDRADQVRRLWIRLQEMIAEDAGDSMSSTPEPAKATRQRFEQLMT